MPHASGASEGGNFNAYWSLKDNVFAVRMLETQSQNEIIRVRDFDFRGLETEDFSYRKFKFIQE